MNMQMTPAPSETRRGEGVILSIAVPLRFLKLFGVCGAKAFIENGYG